MVPVAYAQKVAVMQYPIPALYMSTYGHTIHEFTCVEVHTIYFDVYIYIITCGYYMRVCVI